MQPTVNKTIQLSTTSEADRDDADFQVVTKSVMVDLWIETRENEIELESIFRSARDRLQSQTVAESLNSTSWQVTGGFSGDEGSVMCNVVSQIVKVALVGQTPSTIPLKDPLQGMTNTAPDGQIHWCSSIRFVTHSNRNAVPLGGVLSFTAEKEDEVKDDEEEGVRRGLFCKITRIPQLTSSKQGALFKCTNNGREMWESVVELVKFMESRDNGSEIESWMGVEIEIPEKMTEDCWGKSLKDSRGVEGSDHREDEEKSDW
jgi:hypothetical protein